MLTKWKNYEEYCKHIKNKNNRYIVKTLYRCTDGRVNPLSFEYTYFSNVEDALESVRCEKEANEANDVTMVVVSRVVYIFDKKTEKMVYRDEK